jgi:deazaflavin-dependent oxidoreductase (nitroreductase family)
VSEISDSPTGWVAKHIRDYVATGGRVGHRRWGVYTLLLTTRGRRSGRLRRTALIYGTDGDGRYVVVASNGGKPANPDWYHNLLAHPEAHVQVGAETFTATAVEATGAERDRLWAMMAELWPDYARYGARATRPIPVMVLQQTSPSGQPATA